MRVSGVTSRSVCSARLLAVSLLSLSFLTAPALAKPAYGSSKLLVVLDSKDVKRDDFGKFWESLEGRGFQLTFRDARTGNPEQEELLMRLEEKQYGGLILFAPSLKALPGDLSPQAIYQFMTSTASEALPSNVLIALNPSLSEAYRDFAREFGIEFDERDTALYDPFHASSYSSSSRAPVIEIPANHTFTSSPVYEGLGSIISMSTKRSPKPIVYSGPVHRATDVPLLVPLLRAPSTGFPIEIKSSGDHSVVEGGPLVTGEAAKLVSGFQTRVGSRIAWSGSLDLFSDSYATSETANEQFVEDLTKWTFNEKGFVEVKGARHYSSGDETKEQKEQYRIGEEMTYEIVLSSYENDRWTAPSTIHDLQLEVTMLDPHLRIPLVPSTAFEHRHPTERTYTATFELPDRHGVFTLLVDHKRQGISWLEHKMQMSITPLRHDEYPRFIRGAYPYYITAASMVVAWLVFAALWLSMKEEDPKKDAKKTKVVKTQ